MFRNDDNHTFAAIPAREGSPINLLDDMKAL